MDNKSRDLPVIYSNLLENYLPNQAKTDSQMNDPNIVQLPSFKPWALNNAKSFSSFDFWRTLWILKWKNENVL